MAQNIDFYSNDELKDFTQKQLDNTLLDVIKSGSLAHVKTLHENYANLNTNSGQAFIIAANTSQFEIFDYLLQNCSAPPAHAMSRALTYFSEIKKKESIERIIECVPEIIESQSYLFSGLAEDGNLEMLKFFHEKGFDIRQHDDKQGDWTLIRAAEGGDLKTLKFLIETVGADISSRDYQAFGGACSSGNLDMVKYLHKKGSKIKLKDNYPMWTAAFHNHLDIIKYLHDSGLSIHKANKRQTPIEAAIENNHIEAVQYFIENGIDIHKDDNEILSNAIWKNNLELVKYLVENGANIHAHDHEWQQKNKTSVKLKDVFYKLVKRKERKPERYDRPTLLSYAAKRGNIEIFDYLVEQGADITANNAQVFHQALEGYYDEKQKNNPNTSKFKKTLEKLLKMDPEIIFNADHKRALYYYMAQTNTADIVQTYPPETTSHAQANLLLEVAASDYAWDTVKALIEHYDVDINTDNGAIVRQALRDDRVAMSSTTKGDNQNMLRYLIKKGACIKEIQEKNPKLFFDLNRADIEKSKKAEAEAEHQTKIAQEQAQIKAAEQHKASVLKKLSKPVLLKKRR